MVQSRIEHELLLRPYGIGCNRGHGEKKQVPAPRRDHTRHHENPVHPEQSGRTWKLAEILARAAAVFGSKEEAEQWLERPATGLNQRRPIDLLASPAGVALVEDFLVRLEYGVYA